MLGCFVVVGEGTDEWKTNKKERIKRMALSYERVSQNKLPSQIYYNSRESKKAASSLRFS